MKGWVPAGKSQPSGPCSGDDIDEGDGSQQANIYPQDPVQEMTVIRGWVPAGKSLPAGPCSGDDSDEGGWVPAGKYLPSGPCSGDDTDEGMGASRHVSTLSTLFRR